MSRNAVNNLVRFIAVAFSIVINEFIEAFNGVYSVRYKYTTCSCRVNIHPLSPRVNLIVIIKSKWLSFVIYLSSSLIFSFVARYTYEEGVQEFSGVRSASCLQGYHANCDDGDLPSV